MHARIAPPSVSTRESPEPEGTPQMHFVQRVKHARLYTLYVVRCMRASRCEWRVLGRDSSQLPIPGLAEDRGSSAVAILAPALYPPRWCGPAASAWRWSWACLGQAIAWKAPMVTGEASGGGSVGNAEEERGGGLANAFVYKVI